MSHWIKIEVSTPDKPEIRAAARMCNCSKQRAFLAFFELWSYFDHHTATGFIAGVTIDDLDDIAHLSGFGQAMEQVGWVSQSETGITISNWERHNGESAKKRALNQKRNQKYRAAKRWKNNPSRN